MATTLPLADVCRVFSNQESRTPAQTRLEPTHLGQEARDYGVHFPTRFPMRFCSVPMGNGVEGRSWGTSIQIGTKGLRMYW